MTSRKRWIDRYIAPIDFKQLDNDIREEPKVPPSVGIFDSPYRCYIVNEQWDAHISGAISALTEWRTWIDDEDERSFAVQEVLKLLSSEGNCVVIDCNDVEDCLETSDIIQGLIDANTAQDTLITNLTNIINENTGANIYPDSPTQATDTDALCDASYYITDKLIDFIDETLTDAMTITLEEFLLGLLRLGGFNTDLLKDFWDFIISNTYPDLLTDIQAQRDNIAEHWYCNDLDRDAVDSAIDADGTIGAEAKAGILGALRAIEDGTLALWVAVGQFVDSGEDCSGFCGTWSESFDFTINDYDEYVSDNDDTGVYPFIYTAGEGWEGGFGGGSRGSVDIIFDNPQTLTLAQAQFKGGSGSNQRTIGIRLYDATDTLIASHETDNLGFADPHTFTLSGTYSNVKYVRYLTGCGGCNTYLKNTQLEGDGVTPFV